jgi:opacity protein-like surface antigen
MKTKPFLLCFVCILLLSVSTAFALDPMGPPVAELQKDQWSLGAEYSASRMDLKFNEGRITRRGYADGVPTIISSGKLNPYTLTNLHMDKIWAKISYGVTDNWDIFLRLGIADMEFDYDRMTCVNNACDVFPLGQELNGDNGFAIGLGTKVTFHEEENIKWGGLFQISWCQSDGKGTGPLLAASSITGQATSFSHSVDMDLVEIHIALGPEYQFTDDISIYGGPFLHFMDGDVDGYYYESGTTGLGTFIEYTSDYSYDIDERTFFGGYIGVEMDLSEDVSVNIEYQHTASADAMAMNLTWKF